MDQPNPTGRRRALLALPLLAAACNPARVEVERGYAGPRLPRPQRILLRDTALGAADVALDRGIRGRVTQLASAEDPEALRLAAARTVATAMTEAIERRLVAYGAPVQLVPETAPAPAGSLVIGSRLLAVDEGNRTQRRLIGLGRGQSQVVAELDLAFVPSDGRAPVPLESFEASVDSGRAPGLGVGLAAGRLGGRVAGAAGIGSGVQAAVEGSRADDAAEGRRIGEALGAKILGFFGAQGWYWQAR